MKTFDEIYIFDLHGNTLKGEKCPDGNPDFNIFNIKDVGVCIALFVKTGLKTNKGVYFQEIFGNQNYKKEYLIDKSVNIDIKTKKWIKLEDDKKWHWFTRVKSNEKYLNNFYGLNEIFENINSGIQTKRDNITIQLSEEELLNVLDNFKTLTEEKILIKYNTNDGRDWKANTSKKDILENHGNIEIIHYRPFDFRYTYYTGISRGFIAYPRLSIMKHLINKDNIGLVFTRNVTDLEYRHALVTDKIIDVHVNSGQDYIAPLYIYEDIDSNSNLKFEQECKPNFKASFFDFLKKYLCGYSLKIEDYPYKILSYIYAALYAPSYRSRYKEDLKYDYPRIPFTDDASLFDSLSSLGAELIDLHLLKKTPSASSSYAISGDNNIDFCKFENNKIKINDTQYFDNVKEEVYNYQIGGYKPIEKYIKARETLTLKDIMHIRKIIAVIEKTIYVQSSIDEVYKKIDK